MRDIEVERRGSVDNRFAGGSLGDVEGGRGRARVVSGKDIAQGGAAGREGRAELKSVSFGVCSIGGDADGACDVLRGWRSW